MEIENLVEKAISIISDLDCDWYKKQSAGAKIAYLLEEAYNSGREDQREDDYDVMAEENINDYLSDVSSEKKSSTLMDDFEALKTKWHLEDESERFLRGE